MPTRYTRYPRFSPVWRSHKRYVNAWKSRIQAIQAVLPDLIIRLGSDGTYIEAHAPIEKDLALPSSEIIGLNLRDVMPPEIAEIHERAVAFAMDADEIYEYEYSLDLPGGRQHFDARMAKSGPKEVTSIIRNITEKRRLAEAAEQQQIELILERERRVLLERFIQDASHDLRTPITALTMTGYLLEKYTQSLRTKFEAIDTAQRDGRDIAPYTNEFFDILHRMSEKQQVMTIASDRLRRLIGAMFDIIRLDNENDLEVSLYAIEKIASSVVEMLKPEAEVRGIDLMIAADPIPLVPLNTDMMERALQNLVVNALNYTSNGGKVIVRLYCAEGNAVVEVEDTGIGIESQHIARIFQRFYRVDDVWLSRTGGSGLGLAIVHRIAELHGGSVSVESEVGVGTTFKIMLPYAS